MRLLQGLKEQLAARERGEVAIWVDADGNGFDPMDLLARRVADLYTNDDDLFGCELTMEAWEKVFDWDYNAPQIMGRLADYLFGDSA